MTKTTLVKRGALIAGIAFLLAVAYGAYLWFMPHRDVQAQAPDMKLSSTELVDRYLQDAAAANAAFLKDDGDSKILAVTGPIHNIRTNQANQLVLLLKDEGASAGVQCSLTDEASQSLATHYKLGETVTLKGVIRAGPEYSEVMGFYIDAVMEDCAPYLP